jgi:serine/threonine protein kinase
MKLILMDQEKEGFPITALREIKILQELRHDNIVRLIEVCRSSSKDILLIVQLNIPFFIFYSSG